jgi:UDP-4-amino-4,6-dideoxy-N-acetyl-beta-L-altrosamine transaminase
MIPIPYGKQTITTSDIEAVVETLTSDFLTQGPKVAEFEKAFGGYIGATYAIAVSNGTAALHLAAMALGVKPGDKVITTSISFSATANCIRYCGGEVVFADIDPETCLIDVNRVRELLESHPAGTFKGIIPVDFAGAPVDLKPFRELADQHGLWIIEDACHAPGGYVSGKNGKKYYCGDCQLADAAIFSFHPVKHIATGEGGMITTSSRETYDRLMLLRTHGITRSTDAFSNSVSFASSDAGASTYPGWYMEMQELGFNYRLSDIQCALGLSQLKRAPEGLVRRQQIASKYDSAFAGHQRITPLLSKASGHAYHLYVIAADNRLALYNYLRERNIYAQVHYIPIHLMPYYKSLGWKEGDLPASEAYYKTCLSLPMYPSLKDDQQDYVIETILSFFKL